MQFQVDRERLAVRTHIGGLNRQLKADLPLAIFFLLLPQFGVPGGGAYPLPLASLWLVAWAVLTCTLRSEAVQIPLSKRYPLRKHLIWFFSYCVFSALYGYWELTEVQRSVLQSPTGSVEYTSVAGQRLLQLVLAFGAFELARTRARDSMQLMRYWLVGTAVAVLAHVVTYVISLDDLARRAGVFTEGNQGGLYYIVSIFIALEYRKRVPSQGVNVFSALAIAGLLMTRSSAAMLVLTVALSMRYVMCARSAARGVRRAIVAVLTVTMIATFMLGTGIDFDLFEKLLAEDVTAASFSRIDRLASIDTAFQLFGQSPLFGHGLQSYGFLANDYLEGPLLAVYDEGFRRIPNNIYVEVAAELGAVGLVIFGTLMFRLVKQIGSKQTGRTGNFLAGAIGVLIYWIAFPTYSVVFVWVYFGIACFHDFCSEADSLTPTSRRHRVGSKNTALSSPILNPGKLIP
jgi:O-antigen ligase